MGLDADVANSDTHSGPGSECPSCLDETRVTFATRGISLRDRRPAEGVTIMELQHDLKIDFPSQPAIGERSEVSVTEAGPSEIAEDSITVSAAAAVPKVAARTTIRGAMLGLRFCVSGLSAICPMASLGIIHIRHVEKRKQRIPTRCRQNLKEGTMVRVFRIAVTGANRVTEAEPRLPSDPFEPITASATAA